jgi:hypothetical protein
LPQQRKPVSRPLFNQPGLGTSVITIRPQEPGPVTSFGRVRSKPLLCYDDESKYQNRSADDVRRYNGVSHAL